MKEENARRQGAIEMNHHIGRKTSPIIRDRNVEAVVSDDPTSLARADFSPLSILVIDDNKFIRRLVAEILRGFGVTWISQAKSADDAISQMSVESNFDIVICDWSMHPKDGLYVVRALRAGKTRVKPTVPFIMLTSECRKNKVMEALAAGVSSYIVKPICAKLLMDHLVKLILDEKEIYELE